MASSAQSRLTELEAVNIILRNVGLSPVSTLSGATAPDVVTAQSVLDEAQRSVLKEGWDFNTETDYPLTPSSNRITIPSDFFSFRPMDTTKHYVERQGYLYDLDARSLSFDDTVKVEAIVSLQWSDLPEAARYYIAVKAARQFADDMMGDANAGKLNGDYELEARAAVVEANSQNARVSMFDNYSTWEGIGIDRDWYVFNN